jgi:hypothetical protein
LTVATVYIDPTVSGAGTGTIGDPFKDWASVTWVGGNSYLQKSGTTFAGSINVTSSAAGSAGAPTTLGVYGGTGRVRINGAAQYQGIRVRQNAHYIVIDGFEIFGLNKLDAGTGTTGIYIGDGDTLNANNVKVLNCWLHGNSAVASQDCSGIKYFGNDVEIAWCLVEEMPTDGIWGYGLAPHIHHNTVRRVDLDGRDAGDCLQITYACTGGRVYRNIFDRSNSPAKQVMIISSAGAGNGCVIEYNYMIQAAYVSIQTSCIYSDQPGTIIRRNTLIGAYRAIYLHTGATGGVVESNLCLNNTIGIQTANSDIGVIVRNNTVAGASLYGTYIVDATANVQNNVFYNCAKGLAVKGGATRGSNAFYGNTTNFESAGSGGAIGSNNVTTDPQLTATYRPKSTSPLLGAGAHLGYRRDIEGKQRQNPPSIGAYDVATLRI